MCLAFASPRRGARPCFRWGLPLLIYVAVAVPLAVACRQGLDPDTVCYVRRAGYLARGDWAASISAYWSPLLSWLAAPLVALGIDSLDAVHAVLVAGGALWVLAVAALLHRLVRWPTLWHLLAIVPMAVLGAVLATRWATPDLLLSAGLFAYAFVAFHPALLRDRRLPFLAGLLGGLAYLAKSFALPFVLVHLPLTILLRWLLARGLRAPPGDPLRWKRPLGALALGCLGIFLLAGPWVAIISKRHGSFTIGTSAPAARALLAPERAQRGTLRSGTPRDSRLRGNIFAPPRDPYITWWENPDRAFTKRFWSPFESDLLYRQQKRILVEHYRKAEEYFLSYDALGLGARALLASPLALLPALGLRRGRRWRLLWVWLTLGIYVAPFALVWFIERYVASFVPPLLVLLAAMLVASVGRAHSPRLRRGRLPGAVRTGALLALAASFMVTALRDARALWAAAPDGTHRRLARQLKKLVPWSVLVSADNPDAAYVSFFADRKYVALAGTLDDPSEDAARFEQMIFEAIPRPVLLIWQEDDTSQALSGPRRDFAARGRAVADALASRPTWRRAGTLSANGTRVRVYVRRHRPRATTVPAATEPALE